MAKMMSSTATLWWVPISQITSEADLFKAATYTTSGSGAKAIDISCAVVTGYTLAATASDTDDTKSICDASNVQTPTTENYEASLTFFREHIVGNEAPGSTTVYDKAFNLFKKGRQAEAPIEGYLVQRLGYARGAAVAQGQLLSAFRVIADNPQDVLGDGSAPVQFTVPFLPQGWMKLNEAVTA